jgi:hypothetical protein
MHRVDATCHWCGEVKPTFALPRLSASVIMRSAAGAALMVVAAAGMWQLGPSMRSLIAADNEPAATRSTNRDLAQGDAAARSPSDAAVGERFQPDVASGNGARDEAADAASATRWSGSDSVRWVPAVARTWVNVRNDASRGGEVVGVIKPAARALLGTDRAGWRQVRSPDVNGWVDPRLFEADSTHSRGE